MMILENQGFGHRRAGDKVHNTKEGKNQGEISVDKMDGKIKEFHKDLDRLSQIRAIVYRYRKVYDPTIKMRYSEIPEKEGTVPNGYTSELSEMLQTKFGIQIHFHGKPGKPPYGYTLIDHAGRTVYKGGDLMSLSEFVSANNTTLKDVRSKNLHQEDLSAPLNKPLSVENPTVLSDIPENGNLPLPDFRIDIRDDVDDEAIHGRNRRRKKKSRTNTR